MFRRYAPLEHLNLYVLWFSDDGPDTGPHPSSQEELRAAFNTSDGWNVATIKPDNPDNLSRCAAPSVDLSKRLDVPGEYWRPRRRSRAQELKTRTRADPSCGSGIAARP